MNSYHCSAHVNRRAFSAAVIAESPVLAEHIFRMKISRYLSALTEVVDAYRVNCEFFCTLPSYGGVRMEGRVCEPFHIYMDDPPPVPTTALKLFMEAVFQLLPLEVIQRLYVDYALCRFNGNKVHTARAVKIDRRTIQRWARDGKLATPQASSSDQAPDTQKDPQTP